MTHYEGPTPRPMHPRDRRAIWDRIEAGEPNPGLIRSVCLWALVFVAVSGAAVYVVML
jgi:hypothetical protein